MDIRGDWFFCDGKFYQPDQQNEVLVEYQNSIYEVLRVLNSVPLFLEDHYQRFQNSFQKLGTGYFPSFPELKNHLLELINLCKFETGNIRIELFLLGQNNRLVANFISHIYPPNELYQLGVHLVTFPIERQDPEIKQSAVNMLVRKAVSELQTKNNAFEVLLIDSYENITEGSKSNIFFIRDRVIYTPPSKQVLKGITRQKAIQLAHDNGLKIVEESIQLKHINTFDSCFLTGTSPKILPVYSIESNTFNTKNKILIDLMDGFDNLIDDYCRNFTSY